MTTVCSRLAILLCAVLVCSSLPQRHGDADDGDDGTCPKKQVTYGTCKVLDCSDSRGPTNCIDGKCCCQEGYRTHDDLEVAQMQAEEVFAAVFAKSFVSRLVVSDPITAAAGASLSAAHSAAQAYSKEAANTCMPTVATLRQLQSRLLRASQDYSSDTGGTCRIQGCYNWRMASYCSGFPWFQCLCRAGAKSVSGVCLFPSDNYSYHRSTPVAQRDDAITGGHCRVFSCEAWRGRTHCDISTNYNCVCDRGSYSLGGVCVPVHGDNTSIGGVAMNNACKRDTEGTCKILSCYQARGPTTCINGECVCNRGYCTASDENLAVIGAVSAAAESFAEAFATKLVTTYDVYSAANTAGESAATAGANAYLTNKRAACLPTSATLRSMRERIGNHSGKCQSETGGSCWIVGCYAWRGPAFCSGWPAHKCVCPEDACSVDGICVILEKKAYTDAKEGSSLSTLEKLPSRTNVHLTTVACFTACALSMTLVHLTLALLYQMCWKRRRQLPEPMGHLGYTLLENKPSENSAG